MFPQNVLSPDSLAHYSGKSEYGNNLKISENSSNCDWPQYDRQTCLWLAPSHQVKMCNRTKAVTIQSLYGPSRLCSWDMLLKVAETFSQGLDWLLSGQNKYPFIHSFISSLLNIHTWQVVDCYGRSCALQNSWVQVLTSRTSECAHIWRQNL